jgi:hypothetical protein
MPSFDVVGRRGPTGAASDGAQMPTSLPGQERVLDRATRGKSGCSAERQTRMIMQDSSGRWPFKVPVGSAMVAYEALEDR